MAAWVCWFLSIRLSLFRVSCGSLSVPDGTPGALAIPFVYSHIGIFVKSIYDGLMKNRPITREEQDRARCVALSGCTGLCLRSLEDSGCRGDQRQYVLSQMGDSSWGQSRLVANY